MASVPIRVVAETGLALVAAGDHMVKGAGEPAEASPLRKRRVTRYSTLTPRLPRPCAVASGRRVSFTIAG
jgi:hypothetical protein